MMELANIQSYVGKMAHLISIVLEMDVTICDAHLNVLGDWVYAKNMSDAGEKLKEDSVISQAVRENRIVIYHNAKEESAGCRACSRRLTCNTESIIAFPLVKGEEKIGGIGIYSEEKRQKQKLINEKDFMIEFVSNIGDLLINQLEEETRNLETLASNQKMNTVIETLDFALLSIDEANRIMYHNEKFRELISDRIPLKNSTIDALFPGLVVGGKKEKTSRIYIKKNHKSIEYEVTYSPILVGEKYKGALLYFKKASALLVKAMELLNPIKSSDFDEIIGNSPAMKKVKADAETFSQSLSSILITGESGTGKEVFATAIHNHSKRSKEPFIAVNCAAIPDNLLESELFGYEEGAFTGAAKGGRAGKFEIANKGTLFLDEIGELPIHLQPKLLRALQEKRIQRVGSNRWIDIDIRIISATNRDLTKMMETGEFREDLYYRLNVIPLKIPALRERKEDIPLLCQYFLSMYCNMLEKPNIQGFEGNVLEIMQRYDWPGNVRELQNAVEYAVNKCTLDHIQKEHLPERLLCNKKAKAPVPLKLLEKEAIVNALHFYGNTPEGKEKAAEAMGISRATMYRKLKEYDIEL